MVGLPNLAAKLHAVHAGHEQVRNDYGRMTLLKNLECLGPIIRRDDCMAQALQRSLQNESQRRVVIDD